MEKRDFHIIAEAGIHTHPATLLVQAASKFSLDINLEFNGRGVDLKSIMGAMPLGVGKNAEVTISAEGDDAAEAVETISDTMKREGLTE